MNATFFFSDGGVSHLSFSLVYIYISTCLHMSTWTIQNQLKFNMTKTEFMIVSPCLPMSGETGKIVLSLSSPLADMECGMRLPLNCHQATEGSAKGHASPACERKQQESSCCWCLSHIFLPTLKSLAEASYVCQ